MSAITSRVWVLAPIPAVLVGLLVATGRGVSWRAFAPNVVAVVVGSLLVVSFARSRVATRQAAARYVPIAVLCAMVGTLFDGGIDGVRRWLPLGPILLNASAALSPWLFLGFISARAGVRLRTALLLVAAQLVHLAQPDAAQATALTVAALPLLLGERFVSLRTGLIAGVAMSALAALAWMRPDPLPAVEHVERILVLAAARGAGWVVLSALAGALLLAPFLRAARARAGASSLVGSAFALQLCTLLACIFLGNFPVPVFGAGAAPVLGWYAMAGVLAGWHDVPVSNARAEP